jgi:hypothetical protein
MDKVWVSHLV